MSAPFKKIEKNFLEYKDIKMAGIIVHSDNPWIKYRVIAIFSGFPDAIAEIILDFLQIYKLRDWIPKDIISYDQIYSNPRALQSGMIGFPDNSHYILEYYVRNPAAIDEIKKNADEFLGMVDKWMNPEVVKWLFPLGIYPSDILNNYCILKCNSELAVAKFLEAFNMNDQEDIKFAVGRLSANPAAIDLIRQYPNAVNKETIFENAAAVDIITGRPDLMAKISWEHLSCNESEWAMDMLVNNLDRVDWNWLASNPGIFILAPPENKKELFVVLTGRCGDPTY